MQKRKPSAALVLASVALFFSLVGAGTAASHYLITSIHQIKPNVRAQLRGRQGPPGPAGRQGPSGATGPSGLAAVSSSSGSQVIKSDLEPLTDTKTVTAVCPSGSFLYGGGFDGVGATVTSSGPSGNTWEVIAHPTNPGTTATVQAEAVCSTSTVSSKTY